VCTPEVETVAVRRVLRADADADPPDAEPANAGTFAAPTVAGTAAELG